MQKYLLLSLMVTSNLYASNNALQFEIVPFDYCNTAMKEQLCTMVRDDQEIQQRIHQTADLFQNNLANTDVQYLVCKSKQNPSEIYGFMACMHVDTFYCFTYWNGVLITQKHRADDHHFTLIETMNSVGYIKDIAVHKDFRGHGIAQALLHNFEETCKQNGMQKLMIRVEADNAPAIRAYTKTGFNINHAYSHDAQHYTMFKNINS